MRLKSICKSFGDVEVLKDFNLNIAEVSISQLWESQERERPLF